MRTDWVPFSASALVVGMLALAFGALLNPLDSGGSADTIRTVSQEGGRLFGMAVMYFVASVAMTLGLPAVVTLFGKRATRLGITATAVFLVGVIGTSGYAMLLVFFRALVKAGGLRSDNLNEVTQEFGLTAFLYGWVAAFYLGLVLLAVALFVAKRTPVWVPTLLLVSVALFPVSSALGKFGRILQLFAMAVAFTGIAVASATAAAPRRHATFSSLH
jgi:hypothetical protein